MKIDKSSLAEARLIDDIKTKLKGRLPVPENVIKEIRSILIRNDNIAKDRVDVEIFYFFTQLGFPDYYFKITPVEEIARTIEVIRAYEIVGGKVFIESKKENRFIYIVPALRDTIIDVEKNLEQLILDALKDNKFVEVEMHKSKGKSLDTFLNIYMVEICSDSFNNKSHSSTKINEVIKFIEKRYKQKYAYDDILNFFKLKSNTFIKKSNPDRIGRYFLEYKKIKKDIYPVITLSVTTDRKEYRVMITFDQFYIQETCPLITDIFIKNRLEITRSYFSITKEKDTNLITISIYTSTNNKKEKVLKAMNEISTAIISSRTAIDILFKNPKFSIDAIFFLNAFSEFAHQFLRTSDNILDVIKNLIKNDVELSYLLTEFQMKIEHEMFAMKTIKQIIIDNPDYSALFYKYFTEKFSPDIKDKRRTENIKKKLIKKLGDEHNEVVRDVFTIGLIFVDNILKTNFFKEKKIALSFKLSPDFLDPTRYESKPYSIIFLYGKNFKGYHIRFQDIARGGIRIVKSLTREEYLKNSDDNFFEVYNLAFTQEHKNKDIPEGGSKGIILPYYTVSETDIIFQGYIDALLDIMLKDNRIIAEYDASSDIIFLGPDEGSAHLMDWAALRAKRRGYKYWRAFTTGKSETIGGISHIDYGMTTTGVHEYVLQILKKLGLKEENITKIQTGGPDGDLGSNEILISKDKTIAVIDGSGVAYDPDGLDRNELIRLAKKRIPIINFNKNKLGKQGFVISINEKNIKLKKFKYIKNGLELRDNFHFLVESDLFVPAGGRPKSINIGNWKRLLLRNNEPRYKIIVEGANLFITQDARIKLESVGVILIKDSSANKGGVTSSSLEVLCSLVLNEKEFQDLMCVNNNTVPEFRKQYINDILEIIKSNARKEFEILWNEKIKTGKPISVLSDILSELIVKLTNIIKNSSLIKNKEIEIRFLKDFVPASLLKLYSVEEIYNRLPVQYRKSIIAREIARFFVYNTGIFWIEKVKDEYKVKEIDVIKAYITAEQEVNNIIRRYKITDKNLINLLRTSIKERCLQILSDIYECV